METLIQTYGYWGVLVGTFLEGETVLILGGFAAHRGYLNLGGVVLAAFVGTLCGDQFFFYLGRRHGRATLARYPLWKTKSARARRLLEKHRIPLILVFRFLYGLRSVIPFAIGLSKVPAAEFVALNVLGAAFWACAVGFGGYLFGQGLQLVLADVKHYEWPAMLVVVAVGAVVWCGYFLWRRHQRRRQPAQENEIRD
jgi:membrane protein DedA with SNARE-associated domain